MEALVYCGYVKLLGLEDFRKICMLLFLSSHSDYFPVLVHNMRSQVNSKSFGLSVF